MALLLVTLHVDEAQLLGFGDDLNACLEARLDEVYSKTGEVLTSLRLAEPIRAYNNDGTVHLSVEGVV